MSLDGILVVDKPAGMTSHDVVARVRRAGGIKRAGHAGTLDPDATGVLIVCIGASTRLAEYLADAGKTYRAVCRLGATTSTEDASGDILTHADASGVTERDILDLIPQFTGDIRQVPPMVSAVHHGGERLYEIARRGETVEREARTIRIDDLRLVSFTPGVEAEACLDVRCGKGTYIRTLCADIGAALGAGGYMLNLRRTSVGPYSLEGALPVLDISKEAIAEYVVPPQDALPWLPEEELSPEEERDVYQGKGFARDGADADALRLIGEGGRLAAIASRTDGTVRPFKVFPPENPCK